MLPGSATALLEECDGAEFRRVINCLRTIPSQFWAGHSERGSHDAHSVPALAHRSHRFLCDLAAAQRRSREPRARCDGWRGFLRQGEDDRGKGQLEAMGARAVVRTGWGDAPCE